MTSLSLSRDSRPLLLNLSDEDFERGYVGERPPSLIAPAPQWSPLLAAPAPAPSRSGRGKLIALFVAAVAASVVTSQLLRSDPPATTTFGLEAQQSSGKIDRPGPAKAPEPILIVEPPRATVQAVVAQHFKPTPAAKAKPVVVASTLQPKAEKSAEPKAEKSAEPKVEVSAEPKAEVSAEPKPAAEPAKPSFGIDEAGF
jgi:hypothetical protein